MYCETLLPYINGEMGEMGSLPSSPGLSPELSPSEKSPAVITPRPLEAEEEPALHELGAAELGDLLMDAVACIDLEKVSRFLEAGASPNFQARAHGA